jgi:hypothetical protein
MLVTEDIEDKLELICDPNSYKEGRIYIKENDLKFDKGGAIYNSKEKRYFYEVLGSKNYIMLLDIIKINIYT